LGPPNTAETTTAKKLKLKTIKLTCGKVLALGTKKFPLGDVWGAWLPNVNFGPPYYLGNYYRKKVTIKNRIRCDKLLASGTKLFLLGGVQGAQGPIM